MAYGFAGVTFANLPKGKDVQTVKILHGLSVNITKAGGSLYKCEQFKG